LAELILIMHEFSDNDASQMVHQVPGEFQFEKSWLRKLFKVVNGWLAGFHTLLMLLLY